jgi:hypothetical protein
MTSLLRPAESAGGQRLRRYQLLEPPPLLADVASGGKGQLPQDCFEVLSLPGARGASPFGWNPPGGTPGGLAHVNALLKISRPGGAPRPGLPRGRLGGVTGSW